MDNHLFCLEYINLFYFCKYKYTDVMLSTVKTQHIILRIKFDILKKPFFLLICNENNFIIFTIAWIAKKRKK